MADIPYHHIHLSLSDDWTLSIYEEKYADPGNLVDVGNLDGICVKGSSLGGRMSISFVSHPSNGFHALRFTETRQYYLSFDECMLVIEATPELGLTKVADGVYGFKVVNYLGKASIGVRCLNSDVAIPINFEIVPAKMDYEDDYVQLTEDIAAKCASLLLDYGSPTSLRFSPSHRQGRQNALEQFIFLRQFFNGGNMQALFSLIKANPDTILLHEDELKPFGAAPVSRKFFSNPFGQSRNWTRLSDGRCCPEWVASTRKYDSLDTVANRFLKFALEVFSDVCSRVVDSINALGEGKMLTYLHEASGLRIQLDLCLQDSFFDDVQPLLQLPANNQVLQKRQGYRQIYSAFNMLDLALQLDWPGLSDVYMAQARNTALLYEYWLAFQLIDVLHSLQVDEKKPEVVNCDGDGQKQMLRFTCDGGLLISLRQGEESRMSFNLNDKLRADFYYNRSFDRKKFRSTAYEGSYSRCFRPDYTIALYPSSMSEDTAVAEGSVSYVHFDAKYRVDDLKSLFGRAMDEAGESPDSMLQEEKVDSVLDIYKRGDLLKMHTYNDAIRKTIGSYVLYPGTTEREERFHIYDELLPGVGAFAIRPGNTGVGQAAIREFISDIIEFKSKPSSRQYRKDYFENMVLRSPADKLLCIDGSLDDNISHGNSAKKYCMVGYIRDEYYLWLVDNKFVPMDENNRPVPGFEPPDKIYFYYHAIRGGHVHPLHADLAKATVFTCSLQFVPGSSIQTLDWMADIVSSRLVSQNDLRLAFQKEFPGRDNPIKSPTAEYYYLVELSKIRRQPLPQNVQYLSAGNSAISPHSPKLVVW